LSASDLHNALRTETIDTVSFAGMSVSRVLLQRGKSDIIHTLHAEPREFNLSGRLTGAHVLQKMGFVFGDCLFSPSHKCFARIIPESFDLNSFGTAIDRAVHVLGEGLRHLEECGYFIEYGHFGAGGIGPLPQAMFSRSGGDGHNASNVRRLKELADDSFNYILTFIEGSRHKGWTIHYIPKQLPVSEELLSMMEFLGVRVFDECPEADFEPCYWRFMNFIESRDRIRGPAEAAHSWYDAHANHFSEGVSKLLEAESVVAPFGFHLFPHVKTNVPVDASRHIIRSEPVAGARPTQVEPVADASYDVAISFAGAQRDIAEAVATLIREAGHDVFYDRFHAAQLWGKDLAIFFDDVFRNRARYCLIFVSEQYIERAWTNHERRSAVARMIESKGEEYILPVKVHDVELPGVQSIIGYVSLSEHPPDEIAAMVIEKIREGGSR
jgi:hypothetical protein